MVLLSGLLNIEFKLLDLVFIDDLISLLAFQSLLHLEDYLVSFIDLLLKHLYFLLELSFFFSDLAELFFDHHNLRVGLQYSLLFLFEHLFGLVLLLLDLGDEMI